MGFYKLIGNMFFRVLDKNINSRVEKWKAIQNWRPLCEGDHEEFRMMAIDYFFSMRSLRFPVFPWLCLLVPPLGIVLLVVGYRKMRPLKGTTGLLMKRCLELKIYDVVKHEMELAKLTQMVRMAEAQNAIAINTMNLNRSLANQNCCHHSHIGRW